ncbi:hypothetical protein SeMB42_g01089 [Synchytrium endobioticum]|uniref:Calcium-transporting ATPase n=1 Tax=Synchytrium endobioticum TaxID=286115 RepID=A0A507DPZ5_9FUNG|nr:hypothetical protein SeLEV6574_g00243 [Synchytrium endobioticum]TPX52968.1 hypothetical protein SeMB42_g01089 [Synchytrium endobioticum]
MPDVALNLLPHDKPKEGGPSALYATRGIESVLLEQNTNLDAGLSDSDVDLRRRLAGSNELVSEGGETLLSKFIDQFKNPMILLLLGSAAISTLMGEIEDAISITLAIVIVITVAFVQEYNSEKSLEALNKLVPHYCHVIRSGRSFSILASELVPGDIVVFATGDRIPADIRIAVAVDLEIDESSLTGETEPCRKNANQIIRESADLPLADRKNIAFMGTLVRNGHGRGIVVGTGADTEFGFVFKMMNQVETRKTPLQLKMDHLSKQLSALSLLVIGVIMLIGLIQGRQWLEVFTIGVSLAVAAIPEGLPIVVTVTLALGVLRMAKRHCIIKKLPSVESLGSVSVICVDKTGTLTENKMTVTQLFTVSSGVVTLEDYHHQHHYSKAASLLKNQAVATLLKIGNVCNNGQMDDAENAIGQPTEIALLSICRALNMEDERKNSVRLSETPFTSERKYMSVLVGTLSASASSPFYYLKGAPEIIISKSSRYVTQDGQQRLLDTATRQIISIAATSLSSEGLRVIACAFGLQEGELTFAGLVGMQDPPRAGVAQAIRVLMDGGVKVVMITGDCAETALSIANRIGITSNSMSDDMLGGGNKSGVMSGQEVEALSEAQLRGTIESISVFHRATPKHKMAIVRAFQANGEIVAMTGDGVNDSPALRLSDIGISMGKSGTDVAKEAAKMILVNDDFTTVLYAIEEGKSIFYNIQNFLRFQLSTSVAAITLIAVATVLGLHNPLNAMQILWINIICDGPVAQSLGVEPVDPDVMKRPPRSPNEPIVTRKLTCRVLLSASIIVAGTLLIYQSEAKDGTGDAHGTTMTFTCFVFYDMFNSLTCRSQSRSIVQIGLCSNPMFLYAAAFVITGQLLVIYVPFLQAIFQTEALSLRDLTKLVLLASTVLFADEVRKWYLRMHGSQDGQHSPSVSSRNKKVDMMMRKNSVGDGSLIPFLSSMNGDSSSDNGSNGLIGSPSSSSSHPYPISHWWSNRDSRHSSSRQRDVEAINI